MICTAFFCATFMGYPGPYMDLPSQHSVTVAAIVAPAIPTARPAYKPRRSVPLKPTVVAYAASLPKPKAPFEALIGNRGLNLVKYDGNEVLKFTPAMQRILRDIQNQWPGKAIEIQSAYRSRAYNASVRGAKGSQHMTGNAADLRVRGVKRETLLAYLKSNPRVGGLGWFMDGNFIHVDAGKKRNWRY